MNYTWKITIRFEGLGGNPSDTVARIVNPDMSDVKFSVENDNGRPIRSISGNIKITGEDYEIPHNIYISSSAFTAF